MGKRILLALWALCFAQVAAAQTFPQPPDVPNYVAVTPTYKTDGTANNTIDPVTTPPPYAGLTNIPVPTQTGRINIVGPYAGTADPFCLTNVDGGTCSEAKFRTTVDFKGMLPDDPIRNYGQPGQSHLHCFFGQFGNAYSTYKSLRQHALDGASMGADSNGTAYWHPCPVLLNPYGNGNNYALKDDWITLYYLAPSSVSGTSRVTFVPRGLRYVFGFDMDASVDGSGNITIYPWLQTILDAANAASGHTRYSIRNPNSGLFATQATYTCEGATPSNVAVLKTAVGGDPYGGTCTSGQVFHVDINGPDCWDGTNIWSPGGYKHLIPKVWDGDFSKFVCPTNYYLMPSIRFEEIITQYGWTDRQRWDFSSDISFRAAKGLTTAQLPPGTTYHTDWLGAWDDVIMRIWETNCIGAQHGTAHECNSSTISSTQSLTNTHPVTGLPLTTSSSLPHVLETDSGYMKIPPAWTGSLTNMHMHN